MLATITNFCIAVIELGSTRVRQTSSIWVEESLDLIEMDASDKSHSKFSLLQFHLAATTSEGLFWRQIKL